MGRGCTMAHAVHEIRWGACKQGLHRPFACRVCWVASRALSRAPARAGMQRWAHASRVALHLLPLQHPACTATATLQGTGLHPSRLRGSLLQDAGKALVQLAPMQQQRWRQAAAGDGGGGGGGSSSSRECSHALQGAPHCELLRLTHLPDCALPFAVCSAAACIRCTATARKVSQTGSRRCYGHCTTFYAHTAAKMAIATVASQPVWVPAHNCYLLSLLRLRPAVRLCTRVLGAEEGGVCTAGQPQPALQVRSVHSL